MGGVFTLTVITAYVVLHFLAWVVGLFWKPTPKPYTPVPKPSLCLGPPYCREDTHSVVCQEDGRGPVALAPRPSIPRRVPDQR
jgi:hypothetical protein